MEAIGPFFVTKLIWTPFDPAIWELTSGKIWGWDTARPFRFIHEIFLNLRSTNWHQMKADLKPIQYMCHTPFITSTIIWNSGFYAGLWSNGNGSSPHSSSSLSQFWNVYISLKFWTQILIFKRCLSFSNIFQRGLVEEKTIRPKTTWSYPK